MNRNSKIKRKLTASLAVGMSVMMSAVPVLAADQEVVYKDETVYVNTDALGNTDAITVSNWLKNSGSISGNLTDQSTLQNIKNIKGEETFQEGNGKLVWNTDGKDIYYQGTTDQELPVSVKLTYYLDGKEIKPDELKGKSGHLTIQVDYENREKKTVDVDGTKEEVYTPFVMMTGMILSNDTFNNVTIDNGKIISDGNRSIVLGFGMPGLRESLDLDEKKDAGAQLTIPESLKIEADVTDFSMSATFTIALSDLLDDMDLNNIADIDELQNALDELENAALELVSGSGTLSDGATSLADGVNSYTEGADELNDAIQMYLGKNGTLSGSVTEYVDGVNKVAKGVQDYTDGANALADGVTSYVTGEQQLAAGAAQLTELGSGLQMVQSAIQKLSLATDGEGDSAEDIKAAAKELAAGTAALKEALGTKEVQMLLGTVDSMVKTGNEMIDATGQMESELKEGVAAPVQNIAVTLQQMQSRLATINQQLAGLQRECQKEADSLNQKINAYNQTVNQAKKAAADSKSQMNASIQTLQEQLNRTTDETARAELEASIQALQKAQNAADGINQLSTMEKASIEIPTIDTTAFQGWFVSLSENMKTFSDTAENLKVQLAEMGERLSEIQKVKESLPSDSIQELTTKIDMLDGGMQRLNAAIGGEGGLSESLASLNAATAEQFPKAISGIHALNDGFETLGEYNASLLEGAAKLKAGSESLVTGIGTLQSGTNQLASGLNTLGTQMSEGSAKLTSNSEALRSGASELQSGAAELAEGMRKFDREGTSKLKNTVEEELGDILDRLDALMSDDCAYQTFSGKDSSMDGNVKFVIETEAIE